MYDEWLTDDGLIAIEGWAREGLTDLQIAHNMGIAERTFTAWKERFPAICAALKKGKAPVDFEVENALLKKALGYTYEEVTEDVETLTNGKQRTLKRTVTKIVPPDTTAAIFWLKNRKPMQWRDRPEPPVSTEALEKLDAVLANIKGVV